MQTIADFKRDVQKDNYKLKLVERFGETPSETMREPREIIKVQTNAVVLKTNNSSGQSYLDIPKASLCEYDGKTLTIYASGIRDLNEQEQAFMDQWQTIQDTPENQKQSEIDILTDTNVMYWKKKQYFEQNDMEYLLGHNTIRGLRYDFNTGKIKDDKIKGDIELKYEVIQ